MRYILSLFLLSSVLVFGQTKAKDLCHKKLKELEKTEVGKWSLDSDTSLYWVYSDTFSIRHRVSPIIASSKVDSMTILIRFEEGWNDKKVEETAKLNTALIAPLSEKFVAAMDAINWEGINLNKQMFLANEVLYLPYLRSITKFTDEDMANFYKIRRLPDYIYDGIGVFLDCRPNYGYQFINEIEKDFLFFDQLQFIAEVFESEKTKIGIEKYK